jgi:predicted cupin superfamily sugar epimerase
MNPKEAARPRLAELLDLQRHPEGGWYRETWSTRHEATFPGYDGARFAATAIYFLLEAGQQSRWHAVASDELWLWHAGSPLALELGGVGEQPTAQPTQCFILGPNIVAGERPQVLVPAGAWQRAYPVEGMEALVSCVVSPGFDFADFRIVPDG